MNIIIEGPDGSGKSTLARHIAQHVPLTLKRGEGPSRSTEEIIARAWRYLKMDGMLFDRHPCISEPIYGQFRTPPTAIPQQYIDRLYRSKPLIIYVRGLAGPHQLKDYDTKEHIGLMQSNEDRIRAAYEDWAPGHATVTYSVESGDLDAITELCKEFCK
ncbi:MAG: hypothetical protein D6698_01805 [Gammaproteobacteria bacterium]|nr:MAG: hypothetical protein D6698_01805 [Gammaproteobacteria bacterium]